MEKKIQFKEKKSEDLGENFDEKMNEGEDGNCFQIKIKKNHDSKKKILLLKIEVLK